MRCRELRYCNEYSDLARDHTGQLGFESMTISSLGPTKRPIEWDLRPTQRPINCRFLPWEQRNRGVKQTNLVQGLIT
jgi:hypothetical protein